MGSPTTADAAAVSSWAGLPYFVEAWGNPAKPQLTLGSATTSNGPKHRLHKAAQTEKPIDGVLDGSFNQSCIEWGTEN